MTPLSQGKLSSFSNKTPLANCMMKSYLAREIESAGEKTATITKFKYLTGFLGQSDQHQGAKDQWVQDFLNRMQRVHGEGKRAQDGSWNGQPLRASTTLESTLLFLLFPTSLNSSLSLTWTHILCIHSIFLVNKHLLTRTVATNHRWLSKFIKIK